jgi:hypothetical protein
LSPFRAVYTQFQALGVNKLEIEREALPILMHGRPGDNLLAHLVSHPGTWGLLVLSVSKAFLVVKPAFFHSTLHFPGSEETPINNKQISVWDADVTVCQPRASGVQLVKRFMAILL